MSKNLFTPGFIAINLQFAVVTAIAAIFFAFSGYLRHLGIGPATTGFILSADALAALIVQPIITPLIHSGTSRRWLIGGSVLLSIALFIEAQVSSVPFLVAARLLQGTGFICVLAALITMIVEFIPPEMSGRAFGWVSLVRLVPYAVIPPLFDVIEIAPASFAKVMNVAGVAALLPVAMLALPVFRQGEATSGNRSPGLTGMVESLRSGAVLMLLLSALLFFCGYSTVFFFLKQFGADRSIANVSLFFSIATILMIAIRLFGGYMFDRYNKVLLCSTGLFLAAFSYAVLPVYGTTGMFFILAALAGLGWGIAMPLQAAVMFDISEPRARGMNQNLLIVMMQGGFFLGPFLGGQIISWSGYGILFTTLAVVTFAAMCMMVGVGQVSRSRGEG